MKKKYIHPALQVFKIGVANHLLQSSRVYMLRFSSSISKSDESVDADVKQQSMWDDWE